MGLWAYLLIFGVFKIKQKNNKKLVFPGGLRYDKSNDTVRTPKVNAIFSAIHSLSGKIESIKKGEPIPVNQFSDLVTATGVEPTTAGAEIQCSIQLSYAALFIKTLNVSLLMLK